jgi:hypothetical protein
VLPVASVEWIRESGRGHLSLSRRGNTGAWIVSACQLLVGLFFVLFNCESTKVIVLNWERVELIGNELCFT